MKAEEFMQEIKATYPNLATMEQKLERHILYCLKIADLEEISDTHKAAALDIVELELNKSEAPIKPVERTAFYRPFNFHVAQGPTCPKCEGRTKMVQLAGDKSANYCTKCRVTFPILEE